MSWIKSVTIWCDASEDCNEWQRMKQMSVTECRRVLALNGWTRSRGEDICPVCTEASEKKDETL